MEHLAAPMVPPQLVELENLTAPLGEGVNSNATAEHVLDPANVLLPPDKEPSGQPAADAAKEHLSAVVDTPEEAKPAANQSEEIPSFNEWAQKQLAEAEKKKGWQEVFS